MNPFSVQPSEAIHKKMAELLKALTQNGFRRCFKAWKICMGQHVASNGNYFEGDNM
jgi:hypothetical protein